MGLNNTNAVTVILATTAAAVLSEPGRWIASTLSQRVRRWRSLRSKGEMPTLMNVGEFERNRGAALRGTVVDGIRQRYEGAELLGVFTEWWTLYSASEQWLRVCLSDELQRWGVDFAVSRAVAERFASRLAKFCEEDRCTGDPQQALICGLAASAVKGLLEGDWNQRWSATVHPDSSLCVDLEVAAQRLGARGGD